MKTIIFTGGGTAGHVMPNLALMDRLDKGEWTIHYIGTEEGIEHELLAQRPEVVYHAIAWGKLRRYFSWKNFSDPFRVVKGYFQSRRIMGEVKPDVLFSKGGYVSVPVVMAARGKCPVICHESDYSPGLANRIASKFADTVCTTFSDTVSKVPSGKGVHTGTPIRASLFEGSREKGLAFTGLSGEKPVLLAVGGSTGAKALTEALEASLDELLKTFDIVHLCGQGKLDDTAPRPGYVRFEYVNEQMADVLALADVVLSRAGANAVFELLALKKPSVLVPLPLEASRGDQILNAEYFEKNGYAVHLPQSEITPARLQETVLNLYRDRQKYIDAMASAPGADGTENILRLIFRAVDQ